MTVPSLGHARRAIAKGQQLVEQRERIAQAAVGGLRQQLQRGRFIDQLFRVENMRQAGTDQRHRQTLEIELQATRQHRNREFLRIGGGEQELDVRRRFLECLQQRIEGTRAQHVHLVDQVHLVAAARRRVLHVVEQFARVIDLGARGGVDFDQVDAAAGLDLAAAGAFEARRRAHAAFAVQALGQDPRHRGLAHAARAREQEGVVHASARERIAERGEHMLLAGHLGEAARTPFAR